MREIVDKIREIKGTKCIDKYLIVKVGGEDCCFSQDMPKWVTFRRGCKIKGKPCLCSGNCPHGHTKEELIEKGAAKLGWLQILPINAEGVSEQVISAILEEK